MSSVKDVRTSGILSGSRKNRAGISTKTKWGAELEAGRVIITIPGSLPSLNEWRHWHWSRQQKKIRELTEAFCLLKRAFKIPYFKNPQEKVIYYFRTKRKRDQDNWQPKFINDALRYAEIIAEDNSEVLELLPVEFKVDPVSPRVEVRLRERGKDETSRF